MQLDVDTQALGGVAAALRTSAAELATVDLPRGLDLDAVAAEDAVRMLLRVTAEQQEQLADALRAAAVLVETAAVDYARAEARAAR